MSNSAGPYSSIDEFAVRLRLFLLVLLGPFTPLQTVSSGDERVLDAVPHHVRNAEPREWAEFPAEAEGTRYALTFEATPNAGSATLLVRQQDVKQGWTVSLNGTRLGALVRDEIDLVTTFVVPPGKLVDGENTLTIEASSDTPDDVRIGGVRLLEGNPEDTLAQSTLRIHVVDAATGGATPGRITILDGDGSRAALHVAPSEQLAVRPGVVYTGNGHAEIGVPAGRYTVFAGRGFEYGRAEQEVEVPAGETLDVRLAIERQVETPGWVACDTHVHTLELSGHGDSTLAERMITLAGEGIELPIATEHNRHSDYGPTAERLGLRRYLTPVMGNEVTTKVGHFNVFPVQAGAAVPDHTPLEWPAIFENVYATPGVRVVILNHARDVHSGVRPFGPDRHVALVGKGLLDWPLQANGTELVNSGAQQTDPLELFHDWCGLVNAGHEVTPVGASDSHDVARHFVGQGRTYIRCKDDDPGNIDVDAAVDAFLEGRVLVSCGLLVTITVDGKYGPGDLVPEAESHEIVSETRHPSWIEHDRYQLFRNGRQISGVDGTPSREGSTSRTRMNFPPHDVWLTAVATGPGTRHPSWPIAKPYQPTSPVWGSRVVGITGAVYVDGDGDGTWTSPQGYAEQVVAAADGDRAEVVRRLAAYDEAVAAQAASLLHDGGLDPLSAAYRDLVRNAPATVKTGFEEYATAWRASVVARTAE